jgi:AraC family transcriptional regulator
VAEVEGILRRLHHGEFFGTREVHRAAGGFALSIAAADPARPVERHTHEEAHFILLLDGHYFSSARGAGHLHAEPALIYNPPGTTHRDTFPDCDGRFLGLSVSAGRFDELCQIARPAEAAMRLWDPAALALSHRIARGAAQGEDDLHLEALCLELLGAFERDLRSPRPPGWLFTAREALHDRAAGPLTMGEVARDAGVHPVHLARTFRRFFGCTPAEYLRSRRVEQAALLVRVTQRPLAEIALECGFFDQSHLTRAFARVLGVSPAAYRRRYRS